MAHLVKIALKSSFQKRKPLKLPTKQHELPLGNSSTSKHKSKSKSAVLSNGSFSGTCSACQCALLEKETGPVTCCFSLVPRQCAWVSSLAEFIFPSSHVSNKPPLEAAFKQPSSSSLIFFFFSSSESTSFFLFFFLSSRTSQVTSTATVQLQPWVSASPNCLTGFAPIATFAWSWWASTLLAKPQCEQCVHARVCMCMCV